MNNLTIKLFKAVQIKSHGTKKCSATLLHKTVTKGFVFSPEVIANYSDSELENLIPVIENQFNLSGESLNATFHKSWDKVANAPIEQLIIEQILHYITTYGFERLGIYNENTVFIPTENLQIPSLKKSKVNLILIKGYTKDEIKEKLLGILSSGIALSTDTVKDVSALALEVGIGEESIELIKNKEVKMAFYDYIGSIPADPAEFLRFVIYKSIGKTLLIKDKQTLALLKASPINLFPVFKKYEERYGLNKLAEVFYRFKPLFLTLRSGGKNGMRPIINRLRRLAVQNHKPMQPDFLNSVTANLDDNPKFIKKLSEALAKANFFRKARLAHALNFRANSCGSILYRIRNGKGFATKFEFSKQAYVKKAMEVVNRSLAKHFTKFEDKVIYIPKNVDYALPTTEKQFVGEVPSGSSVTVNSDMILGVNWHNINGNRIDLDLSLLSIDGKYGWNGFYREGASILFSGDMTDASGPNGATESFYISKQVNGTFLIFLNYFNAVGQDLECPFKFFIASEKAKSFVRDYTVNPNNIICSVNSKVLSSQKQKILGILTINDKESKFIFIESSLGNSVTSQNNEATTHTREFLKGYYSNQLSIKDYLQMAGAKIVTSPEKCDIDLSPTRLEKDTLLNLVKD